MLRYSQVLRLDQFREAQRPIAAAFTIKDQTHRLAAMHSIAKNCAIFPNTRGKADARRKTRDTNALLLASLSYCRAQGGWQEALALAAAAHTTYSIPLKKEWIPICLEGAKSFEDRQRVLEGLTTLYGALPAELFTASGAGGPKLLFDERGNKIGDRGAAISSGTHRSAGGSGGGDALTVSEPTSALTSSSDFSLAVASSMLATAPQSVASYPTANPSFVTYLAAQNITRSPNEVQMMLSALTGRPMTGLVGSASALAMSGTNAQHDPSVQQRLFMQRPVVVRVNRANPTWKAVRELLRRQAPFLEPLSWYPEDLAWVMVSPLDLANTGPNSSVGQGTTSDRQRLLRLRANQVARTKHLLQALVDEGLLSFQSVSSMLPAYALCGHMATNPRPSSSHRVLDLCAAPGGKTQQVIDLLAAQQDNGNGTTAYSSTLVVANDADERRLRAMRSRLGGRDASVAFTHFSADAFPLPHGSSTSNSTALFDGVLLDAPCTGEGRMHRDSIGWKSWHPRNCLGFHRMQLRALRRAIAATKDGGVVLYSTCTMNPLENEAVVAAVVSEGLADVHPISSNSVSSRGQAKLNGSIPDQLRPFISNGLSNWGVPLPNGEYSKPVVHSEDEEDEFTRGGRRAYNDRRLPTGISESMLPPRSGTVAKMVADACVRITPFPRYDGTGAPPRLGEGALNQMESFFMCKLVVKISEQQRAEIAAEGVAEADDASQSGARNGYRFTNADKFTFLDQSDVMMASTASTGNTDLSSGPAQDGHAAARATLKRIATDFGVSPTALEASAAVALKTPQPLLSVRPVVESSAANVTVYDVYAMSEAVVGLLTSRWSSAASSSTAPPRGIKDYHHTQTVKRTTAPQHQQLLNPGTCLFHSVIRRGQRRSLAMPTEVGASVISAAVVGQAASPTSRVVEVPVEFLQHLLAMYQPIPEGILIAAEQEGEETNSSSLTDALTAADSLALLSGLLGRAGNGTSSIGPDAPLPYPSMLITANTFNDPKLQMSRMLKGNSQARKSAPWLDTLLGRTSSNQPFNGPVVLNVRLSTKSRRAEANEAAKGVTAPSDDSSTLISLPALLLSEDERASPPRSGSVDLSKLQRLGAPNGDKNPLAASDERSAFIVLTCQKETVSQLKTLLPRVLGSAINAERNVTLTALDRISQRTELLNQAGRGPNYMLGTTHASEADFEASTMFSDSSLKPLIEEKAPAALLAAKKHMLKSVEGDGRRSGGEIGF